jgi:hypothetical protein
LTTVAIAGDLFLRSLGSYSIAILLLCFGIFDIVGTVGTPP